MGQTILKEKNKVGGLTVLSRLIKKSTAIKTKRINETEWRTQK